MFILYLHKLFIHVSNMLFMGQIHFFLLLVKVILVVYVTTCFHKAVECYSCKFFKQRYVKEFEEQLLLKIEKLKNKNTFFQLYYILEVVYSAGKLNEWLP